LSNNKNSLKNVVCTVTLWFLWKVRNDLRFQGKVWPGVAYLWRRIALNLDQWKILSKEVVSSLLGRNVMDLNKKQGELFRIAWV
jgi:hypothetical protein